MAREVQRAGNSLNPLCIGAEPEAKLADMLTIAEVS
jgi:hypothetical protein